MLYEDTPIRALPYKFYNYNIYHNVRHIRGTTRLVKLLERLARAGIEKVDQKECESIFEKDDWDNLLILDACRHDLFEEIYGKSEYRYSLGSASSDYFKKTYSEGDYSDVVYISANPHSHESEFIDLTGKDPDKVFHSVFHTYMTDWSEENQTVMPKSICRDTRTAEELFPDKKKVVHFMQPHYPFVGSNLGAGIHPNLDAPERRRKSVWREAERGNVSKEKVWREYRNNLEFVMEYVRELADDLDGKTVVTSDHGNLVGENGRYGHPPGSKAKVLRKVPWVELD